MSEIKTKLLEVTVTSSEVKRADKAIADLLPQFTRSQVSKWMQEDRVKRADNGQSILASEKLKVGTVVQVYLNAEPDHTVVAEDLPLDIRYEDNDLLVINKPQGMVVHPGAGHHSGTLVSALLHRYGADLSDDNGVERPGIVHRIDKDTSGLLLVAKNNMVHRKLQEALKEHEIVRVYQALVHGHVQDQSGTVIAPIGRDARNRQKQSVRADGREAITHFELIEQLRAASWLRLQLETGRTHQIRVHMHYIGHPLLGDPIYAGKRDKFALEGQALHASVLRFTHPRSGDKIEVSCELPTYFDELIRKLRK